MRPPSSEDEDEGPLISSISVTSAKTSGRLSDASTLSSSSIWDQLSDWEPFLDQMDHGAQPTCVPPLYDSRKADPSIKDKRKFYNVYSGDLIGCYREWSDAGGRVTGIPGNLHKSYATWELALEAWQQHCLAYHRHAPGFVHGSTYSPETPINVPEPVTPRRSHHNVVSAPSPSQAPRSSASGTRAPAFHGSTPSIASSGSSIPAPVYRRRAWAVHGTKSNKSIVTTAKADRILERAVRKGEEVVIREVSSVTEAAQWFDQLEVRPNDST